MGDNEEVIVFHGGGQYFFWNMGVINYLQQHFNVENVKVVGASAGALAGVFLKCHIDAEKALQSALQICHEFKVQNRWLKFVGIWSSIVEEWLERLLPSNVADLCNEKVYILVSQLLGRKKIISKFASKKELIECLLASTHIPFFMNYWPFRWFQGCWCYDGCIDIFNNQSYNIFGENNNYQYQIISFHDDDQQNHSLFQTLPNNHNKYLVETNQFTLSSFH